MRVTPIGTPRPASQGSARGHVSERRGLRQPARSRVLCACLLVAAVVRPAGAEPPPPLRIGVLDVRIIFARYGEIPALDRQLQGEIARYQDLVSGRRTRVDELERTVRAPGRRGRTRPSAQDVAQARAALRRARREAIEELRLLEESATATVLADIRRAATAEAVLQELDVVVDRTDASILFVKPDGTLVVDVTEAVLARMNAHERRVSGP